MTITADSRQAQTKQVDVIIDTSQAQQRGGETKRASDHEPRSFLKNRPWKWIWQAEQSLTNNDAASLSHSRAVIKRRNISFIDSQNTDFWEWFGRHSQRSDSIWAMIYELDFNAKLEASGFQTTFDIILIEMGL